MFVNFSMHRILLSILFTTSLFAKDVIAVIELEQKGLTKQEAAILTDRLTTKLISIGKYEVVERTNMDKILKEQKFQKSGCTDSECAVEIGQLLNTDFIVIGSVNKFGSTWTLDSRLIDVGLGKGTISAEFTMQGEIDGLITTGITSIAKQLCELEKPPAMIYTTIQKQAEDIENTSRVKSQQPSKKINIKDKTWSVQAGFGTRRNWNLIEISKDFKISEDGSFYLTAGLGATLIGGGFSFSSDYNEKGLIFSGSLGITTQGLPSINGSLLYQWRMGDQGFFSLGLMAGVYSIYDDAYAEAMDSRTAIPYVLPVICFDFRF